MLPALQANLVRITSLNSRSVEIHGRIAGRVNRRILAEAGEPLPVGASVQLDGQDFLMLGEICQCTPEGAGYLLHITVEHIASDAELEHLRGKVIRASA